MIDDGFKIGKTSALPEVVPSVVHKILASCKREKCFQHLDSNPIPSREAVARIINKARHILFPGYFSQDVLTPVKLQHCLIEQMTALYKDLLQQIILAAQHDCLSENQPCAACQESSRIYSQKFIETLPFLRKILATDVRAAMEGDPAAKSYDEVISSYPGLFAVTVQRIAHELYRLSVPRLPRAMTEYAHSFTGIDIHPGAIIGKSFFIDHGTGVVIGETTEIGNRVRIYQGVTLGALSMPKEAVESFRNKKRHPTIEDDVIIYSNTTILGGQTVIGARSTIGGNVWITESVPPDTKVYLKRPELIYSEKGDTKERNKIITRRFPHRVGRVG